MKKFIIAIVISLLTVTSLNVNAFTYADAYVDEVVEVRASREVDVRMIHQMWDEWTMDNSFTDEMDVVAIIATYKNGSKIISRNDVIHNPELRPYWVALHVRKSKGGKIWYEQFAIRTSDTTADFYNPMDNRAKKLKTLN